MIIMVISPMVNFKNTDQPFKDFLLIGSVLGDPFLNGDCGCFKIDCKFALLIFLTLLGLLEFEECIINFDAT